MIPVVALHPIRRKAYITYGLILVNALVFLWELTLSDAQLFQAYYNLSVVPCQIGAVPLFPETALDLLRSMFLHGSWVHLVGNMTFLWIFGRNVEDYLGHRKFLLLYLFWGVVAALSQVVISTGSCTPMIGASGAIAGVLGSFLLFYPGTRVRVMVIFFRFFPRFYDIPSLFVLGFWFVLQLFNGIASLGVDAVGASGGVAFFAHIGGFVAGLVTAFIYTMFNPPPRRVTYVD
jgi:membrane associated rhomboid family serine protease